MSTQNCTGDSPVLATPPDEIVIQPSAVEANAIVFAVAFEVTTEADRLKELGVPGDLFEISVSCKRIASLAAIGEQLRWRAHFGRNGGEPGPFTVSRAVALDLAGVLNYNAEQRRMHPEDDAYDGPFEFDQAARLVATTFASA